MAARGKTDDAYFVWLDAESRRQLRALVAFFETKGLGAMKSDRQAGVWYTDFLKFVGSERIFATFATPAAVGALTGDAEARWDTCRINELNEVLGFYSLAHWYAWQVTVLGLGPVWMSDNRAAQAGVAELLDGGAVFGFGLSERTHGADIYATDMVLTPGQHGWTATGGKYYIGNGNVAGRLSVFGRFAETDPDHPGEYVFFLVDTAHERYHLVQNVCASQMFVAEFELEEYPVSAADLLHVGQAAWDAALATVNVGKVNLGWASIGICEHAFYEAVTHAHHRVLYGQAVTGFPHVRRMLADAYARLLAMKLYAARSADYLRSASSTDRRFLLLNPITKMKVTTEGERVIDLLWEVIAARGFEKDTYFEQAAVDIRALPKLEGTVHVNLALVLKFLPNYLAAAAGAAGEYQAVPVRADAVDDEFLFNQGAAKGLSGIRFEDWRGAFARFAHLPNVAEFLAQVEAFGALMVNAPPQGPQEEDLDLLLTLGQLFTQVVYAQLVCEAVSLALDGAPGGRRQGSVSDLSTVTEAHLDRMFAVFVRDVAGYAMDLYGQAGATAGQQVAALALVRRPTIDPVREAAFVAEVLSHSDTYTMTP